MNLFDVSGKKVIFTGATGGLGQSMAEGLLEAGAEVVLVGASGRCRTLAEEYRTRGWKAHGLPCDLASTEEIRDCFGKALDLLGGEIDVLVNAAGIQRRAPSEDFPLEDWQAVIDVNLTAPFLLSRLAGKQMIRQGRGGRIINIASMCSYFGGSTIPAYSASKGGIAQLTNHEPLGADSPFCRLDNVVLTDHTAYSTMEGVEELKTKAAQNVIDVLTGRPVRYPVNHL